MKMKMMLVPAAIAASLLVAPVNAAVTNDASQFLVVEDFESFDDLVTQGPVVLSNGITAVSSIDSTIGAVAVDLGTNGNWGAGNNFAGIGNISVQSPGTEFDGSMTFSWSTGQGGIGALFSSYQVEGGTAGILLEALSFGGTVLESTNLLVDFDDPLLYNEAEFAGFLRPGNDIYGLRVTGDGFVIDNLSAPVPLPAALPLLLGGIAAVGAAMRRRRVAVAA